MARNDDDASRLVTKGDLREFKSDMRREGTLMIAAGSTLSGVLAGWFAKSPDKAHAALHLIHVFL